MTGAARRLKILLVLTAFMLAISAQILFAAPGQVTMKEAVKETFEHRATGYDDIFAFTDDFISSEIHQKRWKAFLKKKKALVNAELEDVVELLKTLLLPIVESITENTDYSAEWDHESRCWK